VLDRAIVLQIMDSQRIKNLTKMTKKIPLLGCVLGITLDKHGSTKNQGAFGKFHPYKGQL